MADARPSAWKEDRIPVGGSEVQLLRIGSGEPLLILHGSGGNRAYLMYQEELGKHYEVLAPSHPGFGTSDRPPWLETVPDTACFYLWMLEEMGLEGINVIGFSLGGWIAAEMSVMCPKVFNRLVLVGSAGLKPSTAQMTDIFLISGPQVLEKMFFDAKQSPEYDKFFGAEPDPEHRELAERNREMAARLTWKPYMHDPRLIGLLPRIKSRVLLLWGRQDALIPLECGEIYQSVLPNAQLRVIEECGHSPQYEKPLEFNNMVLDFLREP